MSSSFQLEALVSKSVFQVSVPETDIAATREQLENAIVAAAQKVAQSYERNEAAFNRDGKVPNIGPQYPLRYIQVLKKAGKTGTNRFALLREEGAALRGYIKDFGYISTNSPEFKILPGKNPSTALDNVINGIALIDCGNASQYCQWQGIRAVLGDDKFDALFNAAAGFPLMISSNKHNPLHRLRMVATNPTIPSVGKADMVYIRSILEYPQYHPFGRAAGYNAICVDNKIPNEPKVTIHGLPADGANLEQVRDKLYEGLMNNPVCPEAADLPSSVHQDKIDALPKPSPLPEISHADFIEQGGGSLIQRMWIDPKRVAILKLLPAEKGRQILGTWEAQWV